MSIIDWKSGGRERSWRALTENTHWDIVIAGGGVTGAGVAREAARRGLRVLLVDRQDFSWGTSSRSSKMVHGGLRYIAQGDVRTTLHSVKERERLMQEAPGLVDLMPYMMPHYEGRFPGRFAFGMLLKVYDLLARRKYHTFHGAAAIRERYPFINPEGLAGASEFADAVTDDSRLVMRILHEARRDGAEVLNYVAVDRTEQNADSVTISLRDTVGGASCKVTASVLVNATGVWVNELREQLGQSANVRPARGSHIVIPAERLPVDVSFTILHPQDQRPIFVYPWEGRTVISITQNPIMAKWALPVARWTTCLPWHRSSFLRLQFRSRMLSPAGQEFALWWPAAPRTVQKRVVTIPSGKMGVWCPLVGVS